MTSWQTIRLPGCWQSYWEELTCRLRRPPQRQIQIGRKWMARVQENCPWTRILLLVKQTKNRPIRPIMLVTEWELGVTSRTSLTTCGTDCFMTDDLGAIIFFFLSHFPFLHLFLLHNSQEFLLDVTTGVTRYTKSSVIVDRRNRQFMWLVCRWRDIHTNSPYD